MLDPAAEGRGAANRSTANSSVAAAATAGASSSGNTSGEGADVLGLLYETLRHPMANLSRHIVLEGTTAELMRIKRNGPEDLHSLASASVTSLAVVLLCLALLHQLHAHLPAVYGQRARSQRPAEGPESVPALEPGLAGWLATVRRLPALGEMRAAGLDALMLREFHGLCRDLLSVVGAAALLVAGPLHFLASRLGTADYLSALDVSALLGLRELLLAREERLETPGLARLASVPCWAHAVMVWFVALAGMQAILRAQRRFLGYRFQWLQGIRPPRATTLMVEGIPKALRSDERLRDYYAHLFSKEAIEGAYIVRHTGHLQSLVAEVERLETRLAIARAKAARGSSEGCRSVLRAVAHWAWLPAVEETPEAVETDLAAARLAAGEERERVEEAARRGDPAVCSRSGFVTFATRRWCRLASREQLRADAGALVMSMPPDPGDVLYEDLARDPRRRATLEWTSLALKLAVVCTWMPVVLTVTAMADISTLRGYVRGVDVLCARFPRLEASLQGFLATLLLQLLMGLLPRVIMAIITNFNSLKSGALAQLELQRTYWLFQIVFVLLVTTINQTVLTSLTVLLKQPHTVLFLLADNLPSSSHFYINYLAVGCTGLAVQVLRLGTLSKYVGFRLLGSKPEDAREQAEQAAARSLADGHGVRMAGASFMATIALVFCACTPLVAPFAWAYFALGELTLPYLAVYCENRRPDLGGAFWLAAVDSLFGALCLFVLLEVGIIVRAGEPQAAAAASLALAALLAGRARLEKLRGDILPFEAIVDVESAEPDKPPAGECEAAAYRQPECCGVFSDRAA